MKRIVILLVLIINVSGFAQVSFFKDLNLTDGDSNPSFFTEMNGFVYYVASDNLWKTDGTPAGTSKVSNQLLAISLFRNEAFYVFNNELYYLVKQPINNYTREIWKTDGITNTLVIAGLPQGENGEDFRLFFVNGNILYTNNLGIFKIENGQSISVKAIPNRGNLFEFKPMVVNNSLVFFAYSVAPNTPKKVEIWKSDGTTAGTFIMNTINNFVFYNYENSDTDYQRQTIIINNEGYFVLQYKPNSGSNANRYLIELWKTDGQTTSIVKEISNNPYPDADIYNVAKFNDKLIFNHKDQNLWVSDGTSAGTILLKQFANLFKFSPVGFSGKENNKRWGVAGNNFLFSAGLLNDIELWKTDGTVAGTTLLKNINPTDSSSPDYFFEGNNQVFFRANWREIWQSDGTLSGTIISPNQIISTDSKTSESPQFGSPSVFKTSANKYILRNYDKQNGFELWGSNSTIENSSLIKNIETGPLGSHQNNVKIKIGNTWYFNGHDVHGGELWKTDGTQAGTVLVKDLNIGFFGSTIKSMVKLNNTLYFLANNSNQGLMKLFKSDGTANGTTEVAINGINYGIFQADLVASDDRVYFIADNMPWVSDGTTAGTFAIPYSGAIAPERPEYLTTRNNKLFFSTYSNLWIGDQNAVSLVTNFPTVVINSPRFISKIIEFQGKFYFLGRIYDGVNERDAFLVSDGTTAGTSVIKTFEYNDLLAGDFLFLEKTNDKLYFRTIQSYDYQSTVNLNLWVSDETTIGTTNFKTVKVYLGNEFKFESIDNQLYILSSCKYTNYLQTVSILKTDGTAAGSDTIFSKLLQNPKFLTYRKLNNKLFFSYINDSDYYELWKTDGTTTGTVNISTIPVAQQLSPLELESSSLMDFNDQLLFWAKDIQRGFELWQYKEPTCANHYFTTISSGNWDSALTWSCGSIPTIEDIVTIKNNHSVTIPVGYRAYANQLTTELGAVLDIKNGAFILVSPH
jgi:ELWxxDGT repeat protein